MKNVHLVVKYCKIDKSAREPKYAYEGDSGLDLCANISFKIKAGTAALIPTGIALEIPMGFEGQIRPKSGLALKYQVTVLNSPGTIDANYRGEIQVLLMNFGKRAFEIHAGNSIAQLIICKREQVKLKHVRKLKSSNRASRGFGSSSETQEK